MKKGREYFAAEDVSGIEFDWEYYIPSFSPEEIYSPGALKRYRHGICLDTLMKLQRFRDYVNRARGCGLLVNFGNHKRRGVRTAQDQVEIVKKFGGARDSMHVAGRAFDITMSKRHDTYWLGKSAVDFGWTGVGFYPTFVHVDTRTCFDGQAVIWDKMS